MANYYGRPLVLDTVWTAGTIPAALKPPTGPSDTTNTRNNTIDAKRIVWVGQAAATDTVVITDINSNVILTAKASASVGDQTLYDRDRFPLKLKMGGWVLSTLGSGKVVIYY
jgi:hypothetical protein